MLGVGFATATGHTAERVCYAHSAPERFEMLEDKYVFAQAL